MLSPEARRKLTAGAVFALPIAIVWTAGALLGGPESARAETTLTPAVMPPAIAGATAKPVTAAERAALDHIVQLRQESFGTTPFLHSQREQQIVVMDDPELAPPPAFTVKAIMASSSGNRALIGGSAYRLGDVLGDTGWIIVEIDAKLRRVTVRDPETDRTHSASVE